MMTNVTFMVNYKPIFMVEKAYQPSMVQILVFSCLVLVCMHGCMLYNRIVYLINIVDCCCCKFSLAVRNLRILVCILHITDILERREEDCLLVLTQGNQSQVGII